MKNKCQQILKNIFGFSSFRKGQEEIILNILDAQNVLAVMPTGAGKSICYQIPAFVIDKKTIIVSPLISLIDDQIDSLKVIGINAEKLHSNQTKEEMWKSWNEFNIGKSKILYVSPERLMTESMLEALKQMDIGIGLFIIDEVHCVSKWGQSFRPDYEELSRLRNIFPNSTIAGFTATADKSTRLDIMEKIFHNQVSVFVKGFDRPNLSLSILQKNNWKKQLLDFLSLRKEQSGIVYCLSRKKTDEVTNLLKQKGFKASSYHAGLDGNVRKKAQNLFMSEKGYIIVATVAFGMGIDKPDIRYVVHVNLPGSMEDYYQQIGRAGRDGNPSDTLLIYGLDDLIIRRKMIEESFHESDLRLREHKRLDYLLSYCESPECRRKTLLNYFDDQCENCDNCDNCNNPPNLIDGTELAQKIMSTIYRTGQFFGQVHVINVLRGSEDQKVIEKNHNSLSVYGIGKDRTKEFWQTFLRQLLAFGHLQINFQKYGAIQITESGIKILKNQKSFYFKEINDNKTSISKHSKRVSSNDLNEIEMSLLIKLKKLRLELAKEQRVPAFVIFNDASLIQMVKFKPRTEEDFIDIDGVGPLKLKKFGKAFIKIIIETLNN